MNYFRKSKFWNFRDVHNFACATPKWSDEVSATEISVISSEIRNLNFRWESRIRQWLGDWGPRWQKFRRFQPKLRFRIFDEIVEISAIRGSIALSLSSSRFSSKIEISNFRWDHRNFCRTHLIAPFWGCTCKIMNITKISKFRFPKIIHVPPRISNPKNNQCLLP